MRPNVAIPQGDIYPNGVPVTPPNADVQATVRPAGTFFQKSPGYETIRPGKSVFQKGHHGLGIHFTPLRFAEDVQVMNNLPLLVDASTSADHTDIADLPGSEDLDAAGMLSPDAVAANKGVLMSEGTSAAPTGGKQMHRGNHTLRDMGDREIGRPLSRFFNGVLHNPVGAFRDEYREDPVIAVGAAGLIVGLIYFISREMEGNYRRRSRGGNGPVSGAVAPVAAVPVAATDTAGSAIKESAEVANEAATAAGKAAEKAASAAGDVAEAAGDAVAEVAESVGDAVTGD